MASTETGDDHAVELIVRDVSVPEADAGVAASEEITPLLTQAEKPKINIFTVSYPRRKAGVQIPIHPLL